MRLILLRSNCSGGRACPNINATDRGSYVAQGYLVAYHAALAPGESVVEIPAFLLPELTDHEADHDSVRRTDHGTILIRGRTLTDVAALRELNLPAGEAAVEILMSSLPELEIAHAR